MITKAFPYSFLKYLTSFRIAWKDSLFHPNKMVAHLILGVVRVGVLISLYTYAFRYLGGPVNGIDVPIVAVSVSFYFVMFVFGIRQVYRDINEDVYSGKIELYLNKPINYIFYKLFYRAGMGVFDALFSFLTAIVLIHLFIGLPATLLLPEVILGGLVLFFLGAVLVGIIYSLVGVSSFWIENSEPVFWIVDKTAMILGGSYVPIALFPDFLQNLSLYSPFGAALFVTRIPYPNFISEILVLIFLQILWILCLGFLLAFLYRKARKQLSVNGG
jgi:ABC-2 type transport system permease protein